VHEPENVIEDLRVVRIGLELYQLDVDNIQTLVGFRQEFPKQIIHRNTLLGTQPLLPKEDGGKRLRMSEQIGPKCRFRD
jgi:hypothetical protein